MARSNDDCKRGRTAQRMDSSAPRTPAAAQLAFEDYHSEIHGLLDNAIRGCGNKKLVGAHRCGRRLGTGGSRTSSATYVHRREQYQEGAACDRWLRRPAYNDPVLRFFPAPCLVTPT